MTKTYLVTCQRGTRFTRRHISYIQKVSNVSSLRKMETVIFTCSLNTQKIRYDAKILQGESAIEPLYKLIYRTSIILSDQDIIKIYKDLNNVI